MAGKKTLASSARLPRKQLIAKIKKLRDQVRLAPPVDPSRLGRQRNDGLLLHWEIGHLLDEHLGPEERAVYSREVIKKLAAELACHRRTLYRALRLARRFEEQQIQRAAKAGIPSMIVWAMVKILDKNERKDALDWTIERIRDLRTSDPEEKKRGIREVNREIREDQRRGRAAPTLRHLSRKLRHEAERLQDLAEDCREYVRTEKKAAMGAAGGGGKSRSSTSQVERAAKSLAGTARDLKKLRLPR